MKIKFTKGSLLLLAFLIACVVVIVIAATRKTTVEVDNLTTDVNTQLQKTWTWMIENASGHAA